MSLALLGPLGFVVMLSKPFAAHAAQTTVTALPSANGTDGLRELYGGSGQAWQRPREAALFAPTVRETLSLYRDGIRDIGEMARVRSLAPATIVSHLAELLAAGAIPSLDGFVEPAVVELVRSAAGAQPIGALKPLKERLGGAVSYDDLHLIRAWLSRNP